MLKMAIAQIASFEQLSSQDGLSQASVTAIIQDNTGFLWFGTYDGLNRYDGYSFKVFTQEKDSPHSLSHNFVRAITIDKAGRIWVGTMGGGLNLYNPELENFTSFKNDPQDTSSISYDLISSLFADEDGFLWIGTWGGGMNKLNLNEDFIHKPHFEKFNHTDAGSNESWNRVSSIYRDASGTLWIGSPAGLSKYSIKENIFENFTNQPGNPNSISGNNVSDICEDNDGQLWVGTWDSGLNRYNPKTAVFKRFPFKEGNSGGPGHTMIMNLYKDPSGELWVGTWGGGLNKIQMNKGQYEFISLNKGLKKENNSGDFIYSIFKDEAGVLWVGTDWQGIRKYDKGRFDFQQITADELDPDWLNQNTIFAFLKDKKNHIWIGTRNGGINIYDPVKNKFRHIKNDPRNPKSLISNTVRTFIDDGDGYIWIGTEIGLDRYNYKTDKIEHYDILHGSGLFNFIVLSICQDDSGNIWMGTFTRGVFKYNPNLKHVEIFLPVAGDPNSISSNLVRHIYNDSKGRIWFATDNSGISQYDPILKKFNSYQHNPENPNSINGDDMITIFEDSNGNMWFGARSGINKMVKEDGNNSIFTHYTIKDGLPSNSIQSIVEDDNGYLWISTSNGLSRFNPKSVTFKNFDLDDGLQGREFSSNSFLKDPANGMIYFGGINGFNLFHPDSIRENTIPPKIVFTDFKIANKNVPISGDGDSYSLKKSISNLDEINLSNKENIFSIEFAALHFNAPLFNKYIYKLQGFDQDWNSANFRQRVVTYTNLAPGEYTFRVKAANNDDVWNEHDKVLKISISPPFWQTWWFITLITLGIFLLFYWIYKIRTNSIQKHNLSLEKAVTEKTAEMKRLMEQVVRQEKLATIGQVSGSIAHELRNPLSVVKQSAFYLKRKLADLPENYLKHLTLMDSELNNAEKVIENLLEMTRQKNIQIGKFDLKRAVEKSIFRSKPDDKEINFVVNFDSFPIHADEVLLTQVLINIITNACQSVENKGMVKIYAYQTQDKKTVVVSIKDNGCGIDNEQLNKVFEPLFTTKAKGSGLGLSICKQIIENHGGKIEIASTVNKGTEVKLILPNTNNL
jgi:ligand-binding sensor domain-containing protein/signal transduction histidine kinase